MELFIVGNINTQKEDKDSGDWRSWAFHGVFDSEDKAIAGCYDSPDCWIAKVTLNETYPNNNVSDLTNHIEMTGSYYPFNPPERHLQGSLTDNSKGVTENA